MSKQDYDIVIAGGGIVGCAAALALSESTSYSIAVIEAFEQTPLAMHPSFDARVVALAKASFAQLEQFGITMNDSDLSYCPIQHIHVSDKGHLGQVQLEDDDALGYVVSLAELGHKMQKQLTQRGINYYCPDSLVSVERLQGCTKLQLTKQRISAKLVLIAEGGKAPSRKLFGLQAHEHEYAQSAIIANVITQLPHENRAYERFTAQGPIALLPMETPNGDQMSLVWTTDRDNVDALMGMNDDAFLAKLQHLFSDKLGRFKAASTRYSYPLSLMQVPQFSAHRVICLGNAAQSLHPIAGQGFNLGVRDVGGLVEVLQDYRAAHSDTNSAPDPGIFAVTNAYTKNRQNDKKNVINATDTLVSVFSNQYLPLIIGRNISLIALNHNPSLKNTLASFAMGER